MLSRSRREKCGDFDSKHVAISGILREHDPAMSHGPSPVPGLTKQRHCITYRNRDIAAAQHLGARKAFDKVDDQ